MQQWQQKSSKQENPLLSRLKGIDPEFGQAFEQIYTKASSVEALQQRLEEMQHAALRQQAVSTINSLHAENKVAKEQQDFYNAMIENEVRNNPNVNLSDLPQIYAKVHGTFSKFLETQRRVEKESYVENKKKDSSIPTTTKGKQVPAKKGFEYSSNPEEARKQLVSNVMSSLRQGKNP